MQVKEIISFYINDSSKTLDVTFRMEIDSDDEIRNDSILIETVENYGYEFLNDDDSFLYDDEDSTESDFNDENYQVDESEVMSFLNEYYMVNSNKLPPSELF